MRKRHYKATSVGVGLVSLLTVGAMLVNAMPAAAVDFAHPAFKRVWDRTDSLVASGQVSRTFFWGPAPLEAVREQYVDAPDGTQTRLVQYFDKSRMEINNPAGNQNTPFFVTNGLLTIELISGQMQIGNNAFVNRFSANIPISGDTDDPQAPTYASFLAVSNTRRSDHPQPDRTGQHATGTINKAGQVGNDPSKASDASKIAYYEPSTRHNIPNVFWQFLNASGPISETGQISQTRLIDPWFYASGLPISDAYWSRVKIGGRANVDVMIQAYERRVLTYVPTNPPGFRVEMGNIGLHYRDWRYTDAGRPTGTVTAPSATGTITITATVATTATVGGPTFTATPPATVATATGTPPTSTPTVTPTPNVITQGVIAFTSQQTGNKEIFRIKVDGTEAVNLTRNPAADDYAAFSPDFTKIAFSTNRDAGNEDIYVMNADGSGLTRLTSDPARDFAPTWSPDGSRIAFVSTRNGNQEDVFVMNSNGTNQTNITLLPGPDNEPSWGSNGRIVFTSGRSGARQIYTVNPDGTALSNPLTTAGENFLPRWNNRGNRIVFVSLRDSGQQEIYIMGGSGQEQTRLTNNTVADWDPSFAPDDTKIVYSTVHIVPNNLELYIMDPDGTDPKVIAIMPGNDTHPSWGIKTTP